MSYFYPIKQDDYEVQTRHWKSGPILNGIFKFSINEEHVFRPDRSVVLFPPRGI